MNNHKKTTYFRLEYPKMAKNQIDMDKQQLTMSK